MERLLSEGSVRSGNGVSWEDEKALHTELVAARDAEAERERQRAYAAVSAALANYRWWSWTNIVNSIRIWMQSWRQRYGSN